MPQPFQHNGSLHRIVGRRRRDDDAAFGEARYNVLQKQRTVFGLPMGWVDVQEERVPDHAVISLGTMGDSGGWTTSLPRAGFPDR